MILEKLRKNVKSVTFYVLLKTVKSFSFFCLGKSLKERNTVVKFEMKDICKDLLIAKN